MGGAKIRQRTEAKVKSGPRDRDIPIPENGTAVTPRPAPSTRWTFFVILLWLLSGVVVLPISGLCFMIFDAPGSEKVIWNHLVAWTGILFPVVCLASAMGLNAIRIRALRGLYNRRAAIFLAVSPLLVILLFLLGLVGSYVV